MKKGIAILLVFLPVFYVLIAQETNNKLDSLLQEYELVKQDTSRIRMLINIANEFRYQMPDTALYYSDQSILLAEQLLSGITTDQADSDSYRETILFYLLRSYQINGIIYANRGSFHKAIDYYLKSLEIAEDLQDKDGMAACYNNIGNVHAYQGIYNKAIKYYLKSLKIDEELGDKKGMSAGFNNIGNIHADQGSYDKAIEYYLKSLKIKEELKDKKGMSNCYNNIGLVHSDQGNYDKAIEYYFKSFKIDEELKDKKGMSVCYNNIGLIHSNQGNYYKAIEFYLKSLKIREEIRDKNGVATVYGNIASLHVKLADSTTHRGTGEWEEHLKAALEFGNKSFNLALEIDAVPLQNDASAHLQKAYTKLGLFEKAIKYAEIYIATQDSMFSEDKTKALTEMEAKFESEKKQLQIEKMEQQKELDDITIEAQQAKNHKQQIMIFSAVGGLLTVLVFSMIILRMFRLKRKANVLLAAQNDEIKKQKEQIEEQNSSITDSIVYAQRIQRALLPPGDYMKQLLPHRFILYKPRDIVSGDFYWVSKKDDLVITAAADCTGHGVPGAMMSMLGVSILNEIVNSIEKLDAGEILNDFRSKLIESLHQGGEESNMWDGIDIALCLIDLGKKELQFAGANCPLYLIRDSELMEIKGDKMPIGIHARMDPFSRQLIKTQKDDMFYMFSDGYIDQFGGENDKRFTRRRFKDLLLGVHNESMKDQKESLEKAFEQWKGETEQVDDILVMGVRI